MVISLFKNLKLKNKKFGHKPNGFTLAELLIATTVLLLIITFSASIYVHFFGSLRNLRAANLVYEEARFTMERMVKEARNGTIDYEEYYNQNVNVPATGANDAYGKNYCQYSRQFYNVGTDDFFGTIDDESVGRRDTEVPAAIGDPIKNALYLINIDGTKRTYLKRVEKKDGEETIGKIAMIQLNGKDYGIDHLSAQESGCPQDEGEKDGRVDTWLCADGFTCEKESITSTLANGISCNGTVDVIRDTDFVDITPSSLDIVDLKFIITPQDDPRKAYDDMSVQIQPHVTIRLVARANKRLTDEFRMNRTPDIVLESTVSSRVYNEIITECNLKECLSSQTKDCPNSVGVCAGATQSCSQSVWPGCSAEKYTANAISLSAIYENGSETASCTDDGCKALRCNDDQDNDCNGLADEEDPACLLYLCSNGVKDAEESCIDVGGICDFIRPEFEEETGESFCSDGYDNDCNGLADEFDTQCIDYLCSNGTQNPPRDEKGNVMAPFFAPSGYPTKNYLVGEQAAVPQSTLNESCPDVGGLCSAIHPRVTNEVDELCFDNVDNDCDGRADELDPGCKISICGNGQRDCGLVPQNYTPLNILSGYANVGCLPDITLDEACVDAGGLCGGLISEDTDVLCSDGVDNDCDGKLDGNQKENSDTQCCPDKDTDGFSESSLTCNPAHANTAPPYGKVDCDESDSEIYPGAVEICDDAKYPADYADASLADNPIDNNCSFSNELSITVWDHDDPSCCVDKDGDGYGIAQAYIYFNNADTYKYKDPKTGEMVDTGTVLCGISGAAHQIDKTALIDCNDTNPDIHAGAKETGALCHDGIDNDCNGLFDHIDDNPTHFEPSCCDFNAIEICNDKTNSDENCNGKKGAGDDYCINADGRSFTDHFTSTHYRFDAETTAQWSGNGMITIAPPEEPEQNAMSILLPINEITACDNIRSVTVTPTADLPTGTDIEYQVSIDGGLTWCGNLHCDDWITGADVSGGNNTVHFDQLDLEGNQLRWRALFHKAGANIVPVLKDIQLNFICE